jgi:hypothetical protein
MAEMISEFGIHNSSAMLDIFNRTALLSEIREEFSLQEYVFNINYKL